MIAASGLSHPELELLEDAFERPFDWIMTETPAAEEEIHRLVEHANGLRFFLVADSTTAPFTLHWTRFHGMLGLTAKTELFADSVGFEYDVPYDPKPDWQPAEDVPILSTIHDEGGLRAASLGRVFDMQAGRTGWERLRAVMMAASYHWNAHGWQWHYAQSKEEHLIAQHPNTARPHKMETLLYPVLEHYNLLILQDGVFQIPTRYRLPHLDQYTQHQKLQMQTVLDHMPHLPQWLSRCL